MPVKKQYAVYIIQAICDKQWGIKVEGTIITNHTLYLQQISFQNTRTFQYYMSHGHGQPEISTMQTIHTTYAKTKAT